MGNGCRKSDRDKQIVKKMQGIHELPKKDKKSKTPKTKQQRKGKKYENKTSSSNSQTNSYPLTTFNNNEYTSDRPPLPNLPGQEVSS